ncbi:unconventional myosin-XVIIIa isoform X3 [Homalodisca vitripennis]|uniref:unconventional myosin-XVIIIa isoform X3 n=1 Tax=Homalodisca vitripennis TaxID=197043 RepID=UPI001EECA00C|nr:unconventional myosin-XVIIIa isoform X3 [Homalodisca vitripennis]
MIPPAPLPPQLTVVAVLVFAVVLAVLVVLAKMPSSKLQVIAPPKLSKIPVKAAALPRSSPKPTEVVWPKRRVEPAKKSIGKEKPPEDTVIKFNASDDKPLKGSKDKLSREVKTNSPEEKSRVGPPKMEQQPKSSPLAGEYSSIPKSICDRVTLLNNCRAQSGSSPTNRKMRPCEESEAGPLKSVSRLVPALGRRIFFRVGVLSHLESQRDEKLADRVVHFQAHCRGYLARKRFAKRKVEQLAVRCIQRNVRKFLSVRNWPWWRLLVRVMPLLNVHRTEEELRAKTEELDNLKNKFEKLEQEKCMLKLETSKLEAKLSELTMDLAEEHSSATLANQRLKIESAEKMRLEKELDEIQKERKQLQESSDRLEMELLYSQGHSGAVNGSELDVDLEGDEDTAYKQRYERAVRELEFTRRRLQQQHQDDLEQLIALKKQLEKKLSDAYEEVEEQRQVVGQWKKKVQKLTSEMNDLRLLLERQTSRNDMLEKKQRKFDTEIQLLTDELRQEKANKDRSMREKEMALADKYTMEQNLSAVKLELELKEQKVNSLTSEINELTFGGNTEEEIGQLKKAKHQLTNKLKEQEEELDDLAGQVQLLETAKLRLEMSLEQVRKENKKELAQRDEELEEVRCNVQKKVRALECQLENEHEERTLLLRERHEMERRLAEYEERNHSRNHSDQEMLNRLKRDLKRTKALLRDAQTTIEQSRTDTPNKALIRQLRNQLEDAECARAVAVKARQAAEGERTEALATLEDATRARTEAEERASALMRERSQLQSQLDENEEELADVLKKYRATVQQLSHEQMSLQEQAGRVAELEAERATLREQLAELSTRVESMETLNDPNSSLAVKRLQLKTKELESKLELEQTTRSRLEVQITRLKENNERLQSDIEIVKSREHSAQEKAKTSSRQVRELREENAMLASKEHEAQAKIRELDKSVETAEADAAAARSDLRLALQRIEDLQCAIQGDMEDADDNSGASSDSDSSIRSDEIMNSCAGSRSHHLTDSGESSYQSMDRSSSQLRKLEPFTKDSSVA